MLSVQKLSTPERARICMLAYERVKGAVDSHAQIVLNANIVYCFFFCIRKTFVGIQVSPRNQI